MVWKLCKSCLLCAVLLAALAGGRSSAVETNELLPSKLYLRAYESMSTADWLLKREMDDDAAVFYNEALKSFQQLASDYPMWQTNLVAFRINYCHNGLNKVLNPGKTDHDQPNAINQAVKQSFPSESLRSAERTETTSAEGEVVGKIREAVRLEQACDFEGALELYKAVLAQNKQQPAALGGAGRCFLRLGMTGEARDLLFQWCVIPSPENSINSLLALILCRDRQFAKAIQLVEIVLNEDSSNASARVILGVALAGTGQTDAAISEMQKALALNPRLNEAHYNLASLMLKKDPKQKATASAYYLNALKFGAAPDPALTKLLQK